jgi:hypothetical protein
VSCGADCLCGRVAAVAVAVRIPKHTSEQQVAASLHLRPGIERRPSMIKVHHPLTLISPTVDATELIAEQLVEMAVVPVPLLHHDGKPVVYFATQHTPTTTARTLSEREVCVCVCLLKDRLDPREKRRGGRKEILFLCGLWGEL